MIGILGGTFDPIHYGHLRTALELRQLLGLEEVRLIPCRVPPHRENPAAPAELRLAMVQAACAGEPRLVADDRELRRDGPSYTVDTLAGLQRERPRTPLGLILGVDAFLDLPAWHRWEELLERAHLLVVERPGWEPPRAGPVAELLRERRVGEMADLAGRRAGGILLCTVTRLDISATAIRAQVAADRSPRFLLPDSVLALIEAHGCYR